LELRYHNDIPDLHEKQLFLGACLIVQQHKKRKTVERAATLLNGILEFSCVPSDYQNHRSQSNHQLGCL
jgi:hypothetical protein